MKLEAMGGEQYMMYILYSQAAIVYSPAARVQTQGRASTIKSISPVSRESNVYGVYSTSALTPDGVRSGSSLLCSMVYIVLAP